MVLVSGTMAVKHSIEVLMMVMRYFFGGMWDHWNVPANHYDKTGEYSSVVPFSKNFYYSNETEELRCDHVNLEVTQPLYLVTHLYAL